MVHMDAENLQLPAPFQGWEEVESYVEYLAGFVQELAHQHGWQTRTCPGGNSWWCPSVAEAVQDYWDILKHPECYTEEKRITICNCRNKEVRLAKTAGFRDLMH